MHPDPYTYDRIGTHRSFYGDRPIYVVSRDGVELGVIYPYRASTDTKIAGTRLRRPGKGANEFTTDGLAGSYPRRRDVADHLYHRPMTADKIAHVRTRLAREVAR